MHSSKAKLTEPPDNHQSLATQVNKLQNTITVVLSEYLQLLKPKIQSSQPFTKAKQRLCVLFGAIGERIINAKINRWDFDNCYAK
jgi:hypothetical protein